MIAYVAVGFTIVIVFALVSLVRGGKLSEKTLNDVIGLAFTHLFSLVPKLISNGKKDTAHFPSQKKPSDKESKTTTLT